MQFSLLQGLVALCLPALARGTVFDVSELEWTLKNTNGTIVIPASVPSQAHLDLYRAGIITEPLLESNGASLIYGHWRQFNRLIVDFTQRWVANESVWTYTADLSSWAGESGQNTTDKTLLVFYGIDTIANIVCQNLLPSFSICSSPADVRRAPIGLG